MRMANLRRRDVKNIAEVEDTPGPVPLRGPAHCPFLISARLKGTPGLRPLRSQSPCIEMSRGFQVWKVFSWDTSATMSAWYLSMSQRVAVVCFPGK